MHESELLCGNSFELIDAVADGSIQLTVTSPPYNIGKVYEKRQELAAYLADYERFATALYAKTAPGGHVCWQVGNYIDAGEVYPLDIFFYDIFKDAGFKLRNRIIWHFEHGLHASKRLSGRYETILWFSKGDDYVFNLDPIRVPSKYPGKRHFKGEKKGQPSGNPLGKNPSDFWHAHGLEDWELSHPLWQQVLTDWDALIWEIPNVKANHPEKTSHPCQFPVELVQRCLLALTNEDDLVFDPFVGVGSSLLAAAIHQRRFLGFDYEQPYLDLATERLVQWRAGELRLRPLGKPVHQPTGKEKVATVPDEWK